MVILGIQMLQMVTYQKLGVYKRGGYNRLTIANYLQLLTA